MNENTKHLVFGLCMTIALLGVFAGGTSAATLHVEEVKFRGVVTGSPDFSGAVGAGAVNVQIDEILSDPTGNLTIADTVTVSWHIVLPFADIHVTVGDRVEVYGEYRDTEEMPDWWSDVGEDWVNLNISDHYLAGSDIKFIGTAIEYFEAPMPGAPYGWNVSVDEIISGPEPCGDWLNVTIYAAPQMGFMDPNITAEDMVEVYGDYCEDPEGCSVSLVGSEDYYIVRGFPKGDLNHDGKITSADVLIALGIAFSGDYTQEADMDENGCVNVLDARMIMHAAAGKIQL